MKASTNSLFYEQSSNPRSLATGLGRVSGVERKSQPLPPSLRFRLHRISAQQVGATSQRFPGAIPGTT